jgi:hypothetical protein
MSHIIIGVHGLANKPPKEKHAADWIAAIKEGLGRNCSLSSVSVNFEPVHWAHLNYDTPLNPDSEPYIPTPADQKIETYRDGWLSKVRAFISDIPGDIIQKGKEWFGHGAITDIVLSKKLQDLGKYWDDVKNRRALRDMVKAAVTTHQNKRITIIAHSMGSIISYDALRELGQSNVNLRVDNFITIGSPLGLPTVAAELSEEWTLLRTPSIVHRWLNLADPRDPVAFDTHLRNDFDANDQGVRVEDDLILNNYVDPNDKGNPHKIYGYLRCPEMSELIRGII